MKFELAYVDPGSGLLVWQTVMAAFVGLLFYLRKTRNWIVRHVRRLFRLGRGIEPMGNRIEPPKGDARQ